MGKYLPGRRPFEGLIYVNPEELARRVFERYRTVVERHLDEMATNYRTNIEVAATSKYMLDAMKEKLEAHYKSLKPVADRIKNEVIAPAKEAYPAEKARVLRAMGVIA